MYTKYLLSIGHVVRLNLNLSLCVTCCFKPWIFSKCFKEKEKNLCHLDRLVSLFSLYYIFILLKKFGRNANFSIHYDNYFNFDYFILNLPEFSFLCIEFSFSSFPKYISDSPPPIVPELLPPFDEFRLDWCLKLLRNLPPLIDLYIKKLNNSIIFLRL